MIAQPSRGDGEDAWRRYAGALRQQLGEEGRRNSQLTDDLEHVKRISSKRNGLLNRVYRLLQAGDFPAAVDRLARRAGAKEGRP